MGGHLQPMACPMAGALADGRLPFLLREVPVQVSAAGATHYMSHWHMYRPGRRAATGTVPARAPSRSELVQLEVAIVSAFNLNAIAQACSLAGSYVRR